MKGQCKNLRIHAVLIHCINSIFELTEHGKEPEVIKEALQETTPQ